MSTEADEIHLTPSSLKAFIDLSLLKMRGESVLKTVKNNDFELGSYSFWMVFGIYQTSERQS